MAKRKKRAVPSMILWDRRQQQRFVEAVERFVSLVGDLEVLLAAKKRRSAAAFKAHETRTRAEDHAAIASEMAKVGGITVAEGDDNGTGE